MTDVPDLPPDAAKIADILDRVKQFNLMKLPGQMQAMHMGTSYLVDDLTRAVKAFAAAIPEREREIAGLNAALKCYSDEQAKDKAEARTLRARILELEARLEGFECCRATIERCAQAIEPNLDIKTESERIKGECAALKWAAATIRDLAAKPKD